MTEITLSNAAKRKAIEAIDATAKQLPSYKQAIEQFESVTAGISSHIFGLAQYAARETKSVDDAAVFFGALCGYAEDTFRARLKESGEPTSLKESIPVWAVFKSRILRGMRMGLNPAEFKNEFGMVKAVREKIQAEPKPSHPADIHEVEDFLGRTTIVPRLAVWVSRLTLEAEYIRPSKLSEVEALYKEFVERLAPYIDKKRIQDDATRDALIVQVEGVDANVRSNADKSRRGGDRSSRRAQPSGLRGRSAENNPVPNESAGRVRPASEAVAAHS
jgi:hypothetical protein